MPGLRTRLCLLVVAFVSMAAAMGSYAVAQTSAPEATEPPEAPAVEAADDTGAANNNPESAASGGDAELSQKVDSTEKVIVVLDASGSMWGQIEGQAKIDVARSVLKDLVDGWVSDAQLGLVVYGHRISGLCEGIETVVPLGPVDPDAFMAAVNGITPRGKTPISKAIQHAAEELDYRQERATVILLSDGLETCDADPCAVSKELEAQGKDFTTHVIGFGLTENETEQLSCVANNTGGELFNATNAVELTDALAETVRAVQGIDGMPFPIPKPDLTKLNEKVQPTKPKTGTEAAIAAASQATEPETIPESQGLKLSGTVCEDCELLAAGLYWQIFETAENISGLRKVVKNSSQAQVQLNLPTGKYHVQGKYGNAIHAFNVEVFDGQLTDRVVNFDAGTLRVHAVATEGGDVIDGSVNYRVYAAADNADGTRDEVDHSGEAEPVFILPAGNYEVVATHGRAIARENIEIVGGGSQDLILDMNVGYLKLRASATEGGDPVTDSLYYRVYDSHVDIRGSREQVDSSGDAAPEFRLPGGSYRVTVQHGGASAEMDVTVEPGAVTEQTLNLNVGYLALSARATEDNPLLDRRLYFRVYEPELNFRGTRTQIEGTGTENPVFRLPAGDYYVRAEHGKAAAEDMVTVTAGSQTNHTLITHSGTLQVFAATGPDEPRIPRGVFYRVLQAQPDTQGHRAEIDSSGSGSPMFVLPEGDYYVTAERNGQTFGTDVSVVAGEQVPVTIIIE